MPPAKSNTPKANTPGALSSQPLPGTILAHAQHTNTTASTNPQNVRPTAPSVTTATPVTTGNTVTSKKRQNSGSSDADVNFQFGFGENSLFDTFDEQVDAAPASKKQKLKAETPTATSSTKSTDNTPTAAASTTPISDLKVSVSKANSEAASGKTPRVFPPANTPAATKAENTTSSTTTSTSSASSSSSTTTSSSTAAATPSAVTVTNTDLQCTVCFDVPAEPILYQCRSGHLYCTDCYNNILTLRNPICAICRCVLSSSQPLRNTLAERLLARMPATCVHGCGVALTVENKKEHELSLCSLRKVVCQYEPLGCSWTGIARDLENHLSGNGKKNSGDIEACKIPKSNLSELLQLQKQREALRTQQSQPIAPFTSPETITALLSTRARNIIVKDVHLQRDVFAPQVRACNPFTLNGAVVELMFSLPVDGVSDDRATSNKSLRKREAKQRKKHADDEPCPLKLIMSIASGKITETHKLKVAILPGPDGPLALPPMIFDLKLKPRMRTTTPMVIPFTWGQVYTISQNIGLHVRVIIADISRGHEQTTFTTRAVGAEARDADLAIAPSDSSDDEPAQRSRRVEPAAAQRPAAQRHDTQRREAPRGDAVQRNDAVQRETGRGNTANNALVPVAPANARNDRNNERNGQSNGRNGHRGTRAALLDDNENEIELIRGSDSETSDHSQSHSDAVTDFDDEDEDGFEEDDAFDYDEDNDDDNHIYDMLDLDNINLDDPADVQRALAALDAAIGDDDEDEDERAYRDFEEDWDEDDDEDEEAQYWERLRRPYDVDTDDASDETDQSEADWSDAE